MMTDNGSPDRRTRPAPGGRAVLGLLVAAPLWLLSLSPSEPLPTLRPAGAQDFAAAGQRFATAQEAFAKGEYARAAREFQAAYDITQDASLLANIGESWQRAGDNGRALTAYRAYLKAQPDASDRAEIEKRIKALEDAGSAGQGPPTPTAKGTTGETGVIGGAPATGLVTTTGGATPGAPTVLRTVAWGGVALTVAVLTAGAVLGLGAQNRADELVRRTSAFVGGKPPIYTASERDAYESLKSEGSAYNTAAIACFAVSGAAALTSAALFIADWRKGRAAKPPVVSLGLSSVTATVRF